MNAPHAFEPRARSAPSTSVELLQQLIAGDDVTPIHLLDSRKQDGLRLRAKSKGLFLFRAEDRHHRTLWSVSPEVSILASMTSRCARTRQFYAMRRVAMAASCNAPPSRRGDLQAMRKLVLHDLLRGAPPAALSWQPACTDSAQLL